MTESRSPPACSRSLSSCAEVRTRRALDTPDDSEGLPEERAPSRTRAQIKHQRPRKRIEIAEFFEQFYGCGLQNLPLRGASLQPRRNQRIALNQGLRPRLRETI